MCKHTFKMSEYEVAAREVAAPHLLLRRYDPDDGAAPLLEAGCDEVGRGALAGPVVAAAVIWNSDEPPEDGVWRQIKDSKRLTAAQRARLSDYIKDTAIDCAVGVASVQEIDEVNILHATHRAMHRALDAIVVDFDRIIVDGDRFKPYMRPGDRGFVAHECIVEGDNKYVSIAAASIVAKVTRDECMVQLRAECPQYDWHINKGYGTRAHMGAIHELGDSPHHRKTFLRRMRSHDSSSAIPATDEDLLLLP